MCDYGTGLVGTVVMDDDAKFWFLLISVGLVAGGASGPGVTVHPLACEHARSSGKVWHGCS